MEQGGGGAFFVAGEHGAGGGAGHGDEVDVEAGADLFGGSAVELDGVDDGVGEVPSVWRRRRPRPGG